MNTSINKLVVLFLCSGSFVFSGCAKDSEGEPEEVLTIKDVLGDVDLRCSATEEEAATCAENHDSDFGQQECEDWACDERKVTEACDESETTSIKRTQCVEDTLPLVKLLRTCYGSKNYDVSNLIELPTNEEATAINTCITDGYDYITTGN